MALCFTDPFWRSKLGNTDLFGHVSQSAAARGLFGIFYDLSNSIEGQTDRHILMTTVSGPALELYRELNEEQVIDKCMIVLRSLFPDQSVPDPVEYRLSHWGDNPNAGMSYSYIAVNGKAEDYFIMSKEEMNGLLHFAGEV